MPNRPYIPERYEFITGGDPLKWDDTIDAALIIGGDEQITENPYRADPRLSNLFKGAAEYDVGVSYLDDEIDGGNVEVAGAAEEIIDPLSNMKMHLEKRGSYLPDNVISDDIISQSFMGSGNPLDLGDLISDNPGDHIDGGSEDEGEKDAAGFYELIEEEAFAGGDDLSIVNFIE